MVLTAYERAQQAAPRPDVRPKITHCTLINDDLLRRMKALGAVPAPFTTYAYYNSDKFHFYGEERMKRSMAYRSFLDAGIRAAAGSDFSPGPFAPLMGIQGMVTRTGWNGETWGANQRISVEEAVQVNTINGAYNSHEEAIKGSITPGKLADFVVLADDPHTVSKEKIKDIEIVRTVTGGSTSIRSDRLVPALPNLSDSVGGAQSTKALRRGERRIVRDDTVRHLTPALNRYSSVPFMDSAIRPWLSGQNNLYGNYSLDCVQSNAGICCRSLGGPQLYC